MPSGIEAKKITGTPTERSVSGNPPSTAMIETMVPDNAIVMA